MKLIAVTLADGNRTNQSQQQQQGILMVFASRKFFCEMPYMSVPIFHIKTLQTLKKKVCLFLNIQNLVFERFIFTILQVQNECTLVRNISFIVFLLTEHLMFVPTFIVFQLIAAQNSCICHEKKNVFIFWKPFHAFRKVLLYCCTAFLPEAPCDNSLCSRMMLNLNSPVTQTY